MSAELQELVKRQAKVAKELERLTKEQDKIAWRMQEIGDRLRAMTGIPLRLDVDRVENEAALLREAAHGAGIEASADSDEFLVDGTRLTLAPRLAELLRVIAADEGGGSGPLVSWKNVAGVVRQLNLTGIHPLHQLVYRLRASLKRAGVNQHLVQADRRYGIRFARRRALTSVIEREAS